ncbi:MAG: allantoinase AllB [Polyangiaceae bacterium]
MDPRLPLEDVGDDVVMAGIVDTHVHVNEPGRTEWEGFATATTAAAAGGVTTLVDMPLNSLPPTVSVDALLLKAECASASAFVDYGLWGGAIPGNADDLRPMIREGALGFKCFMVHSGVDEFPNVTTPDLERAMRALEGTGVPLLAHAEVAGPIDAAVANLDAEGLRDPRTYLRYLRSRPKSAEDEAIAILAKLLETIRTRVHVVHLSSASAIDIVARAEDQGHLLTAETTPHYLALASETIPDGATEYKCAPPIREDANRALLWEGLRSRKIRMVVTDHSPCTPELKKRLEGDFDAAWGGIASLQFGLPIVWTEAKARGFGVADVSRWMSEEPARMAGLGSRKGTLEVGADADFVIWDPDATFTVTESIVKHRHPVTPYLRRTLAGVVKQTVLRGETVFDGKARVGSPRGVWQKRV